VSGKRNIEAETSNLDTCTRLVLAEYLWGRPLCRPGWSWGGHGGPPYRDCPVARPPRLARMAGGHAHLHGLATPIHETSGL